MSKSIKISEETWKMLNFIKTMKNRKSIDATIEYLLIKANIKMDEAKELLDDLEKL